MQHQIHEENAHDEIAAHHHPRRKSGTAFQCLPRLTLTEPRQVKRALCSLQPGSKLCEALLQAKGSHQSRERYRWLGDELMVVMRHAC